MTAVPLHPDTRWCPGCRETVCAAINYDLTCLWCGAMTLPWNDGRWHGTTYGYIGYRCRCDQCRQAEHDYRIAHGPRRSRAKKKAA